MDWKEFLKPTLAKLLLSVILFSIFVPFLYYENGCKNKICGTPCPPEGPVTISWILIGRLDSNCVTFSNVEKISMPFAIAGLLVAYLISCGIILMYYNKIRKN